MPWTPPRKHVPSDEEVWNTLPSRNRYGTAPYDTTKLSNDHCNTFHDNMFAKMVQRESNFFKIIENY